MPDIITTLVTGIVNRRLLIIEEFIQEHLKCTGISGISRESYTYKDLEQVKCVCGQVLEVTFVPTFEVRTHR